MTDESKHLPGPWRVGYKSLHVFADNTKIGGDAMVCEIRGWGYLTGNGHGALGLDPAEAAKIQDANARLIAAAPDMLNALRVAYETLSASNLLANHPVAGARIVINDAIEKAVNG